MWKTPPIISYKVIGPFWRCCPIYLMMMKPATIPPRAIYKTTVLKSLIHPASQSQRSLGWGNAMQISRTYLPLEWTYVIMIRSRTVQCRNQMRCSKSLSNYNRNSNLEDQTHLKTCNRMNKVIVKAVFKLPLINWDLCRMIYPTNLSSGRQRSNLQSSYNKAPTDQQ